MISTRSTLRSTLFLCLALSAAQAECVKVDGDRILARHLTGALPATAGLPPEAVIGFAPRLGLARWLSPQLIQKFAAGYAVGITVAGPVCVQRLGAAIDRDALYESLAAALRRAGYQRYVLKVIDYPRSDFPRGTLEFSVSGLLTASPGRPDTLWRGRLRLEGGQSAPVVVRVEVNVEAAELRAARDLEPGHLITATDVVLSNRRAVPASVPVPVQLSAAIGKQTRRAIKAGGLVALEMLSAPPEIQRGDRVMVAASSGRASIGIHAKAETTARLGQTVVLANPLSGTKFKATVTGRGRAAIRLETANDETAFDPTVPAPGPRGVPRTGWNQEQETAAAVGTGPDHR